MDEAELQAWIFGLLHVMEHMRMDMRTHLHALHRNQSIYSEGLDGETCFCRDTVRCFNAAERLHLGAARTSTPIPFVATNESTPSLMPQVEVPSVQPPNSDEDADDADATSNPTVPVTAGACGAVGLVAVMLAALRYRRGAEEQVKTAQKRTLKLVAIEGGNEVGSITVEPGSSVTLGRGAEPPLQLDHESCSREHASVHCRSDGAVLTLTDLGSSNRTRVDGQHIAAGAPTELKPGQQVVFAACPIVFVVASVSSANEDRTGGVAEELSVAPLQEEKTVNGSPCGSHGDSAADSQVDAHLEYFISVSDEGMQNRDDQSAIVS